MFYQFQSVMILGIFNHSRRAYLVKILGTLLASLVLNFETLSLVQRSPATARLPLAHEKHSHRTAFRQS